MRLAILACVLLAAPLAACKPAAEPARVAPADLSALRVAITSPARNPENRARDIYRHPYETIRFFRVRPSDTVVEIWPGGGWYTEILAPYLSRGGGRLVVASPTWGLGGFNKLKAADPALYGPVDVVDFPVFEGGGPRLADGTADVVLTFRNVHNWRMGYRRDDKKDYSAIAFRQMFDMLKPGGVLGVVDHRLPEGADGERELKSGYLKVSTIRRLAEQAGFTFDGSSEINANPHDPADWPDGVWTLPPTLTLKDKDRSRYLAVGESDRMTLRFIKPR